MVMHARKLPRLNDGYYDRGSAHPFEDKGSSKSRDAQYNDKYSRKESSSVDKHSPRYANKSSYKDRVDRGSKGRSPEAERRANHHSVHRDGVVSSRHSNHSRSGGGSSASLKDKKPEKDRRIEIQKSALRICNDWSEHLSSSGKRYYYNCKTEVSKWEKPKDWSDDKAVRTEYGRRETQLQKQGSTDRSKHSSSSTITANSHNSRYNQSDRSSCGDHKHQKQSNRDTSSRDSASSYRFDKYSGGSAAPRRKETAPQSALSALQNPRVLQRPCNDDATSKERAVDSSSSAKPVYRDKYGREGRVERHSGGSTTPRSRQGSVTPSATDRDSHLNSGYRHVNDRRPASHVEDHVNRGHEDMDISPGSTPTEESVARGLTSMLPTSTTPSISVAAPTSTTVVSGSNPVLGAVAALPQLISQIGDKTLRGMSNSQTNNPQGTSKLNSAIQTLQKLQEALIAQQRQQQQQLATLIQQQLVQNQLSSAAAGAQHALPSSSAQQRTNGNMNSIVTTSASNPLLSPALGHHSQTPGAAATSQGQHVATSSAYVHHPPHVSSSPVVHSNAHTSVSQNQPIYVVTENGGQSPGAESAGTPLGSPELNLPDDSTKVDNEKDTVQEDVRLGSPALSQSSSQRGVTGLGGGVTALQRPEAYKLPPSLANYFKEDLIPHVTGWPMEILERQADQIKNESHTVGNLYSTQVSCELKKARSLVRVSEIQSTLQEQRVLFIRQQIRELEGFRNTNASFMSPKSGR